MSQNQKEPDHLWKLRHTTEHIFNQAVEELYPGEVIRAMGPPIEEGWYNDSRWLTEIGEDAFKAIEKRMKKIIKAKLQMVIKEVTEEEAREMFKGNPFKQEFIDEYVKDGKSLTVYYTGDPDVQNDKSQKTNTEVDKNPESNIVQTHNAKPTTHNVPGSGVFPASVKSKTPNRFGLPGKARFVDLCAGPHVESTGDIDPKAVKLLSVAGAYWRGDEKNEMLTRVYGTTFESQEELEEYLERQRLAKERDHRKLGKEQDLFVFSDLVGAGLPLWTKRGSTLRRELERFIVDEEIRRGYDHVYTPDIANLDLYKTSGHYPYYKDSMYAPITIDDDEYMLRPMTCPHHFELYKSMPRSYKQLPMRIAELAKLYRYERSGELTGLIRVRSFCLADAHIIAAKTDAESEINEVLDLIEHVAKVFGLKPNEDYWYRLSLGDRSDTKKYYDDPESWDYAEDVLRKVLEKRDVKTIEAEAEAAFYGPKIDIQMKNVSGKEDTAFTCQYDFVMPKRFELKFVNEAGEEEEPVVVHRSSVGAIERIMGFLIERYGGAFPTWMHPEQVAIIPVSDKFEEYAQQVSTQIKEAIPHARIEMFNEAERMQKRIRQAQLKKIPYMIIVGGTEEENGTVNVRLRTEEELGELKVEEFISRLQKNIEDRSLEL